jgi:hypothetical protein
MGVCALAQANNTQDAINLKGTDITNYIQTVPEAEAREALEAHMQQVTVNGMAQEYMGLAGGEVPGGIVPYLLTALNSGGQFLYVDENNIANAADILRAQITNSAGAGRWSDYVSDSATYRHDRLTSWEYNWIDARNGGTNHGYHSDEGYISVNLPASFTYYELGPYNGVRVYENGYMTFGSYSGIQSTNTMLPNPAVPNNVVYPFWDNLVRHFHPADQPQTPTHENGYIYSKQEGDWFAVEYFHYDSSATASNTFETLLNASTGEIRFQYETVPEGASSATIGLENAGGSRGVQVSYNEAPGASDGMGYKFVPAPPQPTKTYTVAVDAHMEAIGFLLAGYSGSFEPLAVYDPDDNLVSCNEAGALCLELDLVQYMQVNVNGRIGEWHVVVDAGPTGEGTFNFTSMAASPIAVASSGNHFISTGGGTSLFVNLGLPVDGNMLSGWFTQPNDTPCGTSFNLYDDGEHDDGLAGDGLFGSNPYTMNTACTAYLWVGGTLNGEDFERIDPVPYSFQPLSISSSSDGANFGGGTPLQFELHNADVHNHCYWLLYTAPEGWWLEGLSILPLACVNAGQTNILNVTAYMGPGNTNDLPSGTSGEFALSMVEIEEGIMSDVTAVGVTRYRPTDYIEIFNPNRYIRPNGDTALMNIYVFDEQNVSVADGTAVQLGATLGTISPTLGTTKDGVLLAEFTSGAAEGTAVITAMSNNIVADTTIDILQPQPNQIELMATPAQLPSDGTSTATLVVTVRDRWGDPVANQAVRIGIEGDGAMGMIGNGDFAEGMTDGNGQFSATFVAGVTPGDVWVRGELLILEGGEYHVAHDDRQRIILGNRIFIPIVMR